MKRGCYRWTPVFNRRDMLRMSSAGFGMLAMAGIADGEARASANPLAERVPHFPSRAKRVIFLFMHGGPSQVDTFDYKPLLKRDSGKPLPFSKLTNLRAPRTPFGYSYTFLSSSCCNSSSPH